jgi:hypothetical protein
MSAFAGRQAGVSLKGELSSRKGNFDEKRGRAPHAGRFEAALSARKGNAVKLKPDFARLGSWLRERRKPVAALAAGILFTFLAAGGGYAYVYFTGAEHAFKKLRRALNEADGAGLAAMVDFSALSSDFARAVLGTYPRVGENEDERRREIGREAQRRILDALAHARENAKGGGHDGKESAPPPPRKLFDPVPLLPPDVIGQISAGLRLDRAPGGVVLSSAFAHNVLRADFPVRLLFERRRDGWVVAGLLNARELTETFKRGADALRAGDEAKLAERNAGIAAEMGRHFSSPSCAVSAGMLADGLEALMIIRVEARNSGGEALQNVNLMCRVSGATGKELFSRQLQAVQRVFSGEDFKYSWTVSLDAGAAETRDILNSAPLVCSVEPKVMTLGDGRLLYPRSEGSP